MLYFKLEKSACLKKACCLVIPLSQKNTIENALATGDFTTATTMLGYNIDSLANTGYDTVTQVHLADSTGADNIVENYQQFYHLYMKCMQLAMNGTDSLSLLALAQLCPQRNGNVVYQARALYAQVFNDISMFNDDSCLTADTTFFSARHSTGPNTKQVQSNQQYKLFPNPNDGSFVLQQYIADNNPIKAEIFDALGRMLLNEEVQFTNFKCHLNVNNCPAGIYMLEITDNKNQAFRFKFVITK